MNLHKSHPKQSHVSLLIEKRFKESLPVDRVCFSMDTPPCILVVPHTMDIPIHGTNESSDILVVLNYFLWILAIWVEHLTDMADEDIRIQVDKCWNFTKSNQSRLHDMYTAFVRNTYPKSYTSIHELMYNVLMLFSKEFDKQEANKPTDFEFPKEWYSFKEGVVLLRFLLPMFNHLKEVNQSVKEGKPVDRFRTLRQTIVDGKATGAFISILPYFQVVSPTPTEIQPPTQPQKKIEKHDSNSSFYVIPSHSGDTPDCSYDRQSLDRSCSIRSEE